jgi:hypothetical protein
MGWTRKVHPISQTPDRLPSSAGQADPARRKGADEIAGQPGARVVAA